MAPVAGMTEPNMYTATINLPPNTPLGTWRFAIKQASAADYRSLTKNQIGDVLLLVDYHGELTDGSPARAAAARRAHRRSA